VLCLALRSDEPRHPADKLTSRRPEGDGVLTG
jgi:hypothetical protein